jgi:acyl-CoA dehydrogenase
MQTTLTPTPQQSELQARARAFVEEVLMPLEVEAERAGGRLPVDTVEEIRRQAIERRLGGGLHAVEHGGQGWSHVEWFLIEEQLGRTTNALSWHMPSAYNVLAHGSEEQIERYLRPALRGELHDAYAVTEEHAGSDPSRIATTATRVDGGWRIEGEKWFVTYGDIAAVYIVMAKGLVDGAELPTLFLVERGTPGIEVVDDPPFTHSYPHGHPTLRFAGVQVGDDAIVGGLGGGDELQRGWFAEERLGIAARGVGAMWRLLEEATACALAREQADPKVVHAKAAMAKFFVSEAAYRCADRAVQIFGGRGYMRNVAERFLRELRVDRIWEGTSEIQRLIVARALERRGGGARPSLMADLGPLLAPRSVAVVGATSRPGSYADETLRNLRRLEFPGRCGACIRRAGASMGGSASRPWPTCPSPSMRWSSPSRPRACPR